MLICNIPIGAFSTFFVADHARARTCDSLASGRILHRRHLSSLTERRDHSVLLLLMCCWLVRAHSGRTVASSIAYEQSTASAICSPRVPMRPYQFLLAAAVALLACSTIAAGGEQQPAAIVVPSREVHAFFYLWYGNPATDGEYLHWNHAILQHWTPSVAAQYPKGRFEPPGDVGATFMPARGLYSSNDPATLESQCAEMAAAGIDVVTASWWPAGRPDGEGVATDQCVPNLLDAAAKAGITVNFHLEPYVGRNATSVREDLTYLVATYGSHPAFYRHPTRGLPLVYIYDSYHVPAAEWAELFSVEGSRTIRGTPIDHVVISLVLDARDRTFLREAHVDGFYTYFAAQRFSWASTLSSWNTLDTWAREDHMSQIKCER